ncbi:hypothetical protein SG34_012050 [Thalassomonas viridans]|uniref:Uncharacterized protein n=1 Tax=Thalassomonas viridans TaxID=137584 RepID=A0AAF0CCP7_9GAMM|nr:hypothetical protein [Thalassomonas viridans]WDE07544.1 hypothetical protein SG34_012050 [Thalassomonas viridans]
MAVAGMSLGKRKKCRKKEKDDEVKIFMERYEWKNLANVAMTSSLLAILRFYPK